MNELCITLHVEPEDDATLHLDEVSDFDLTLSEAFDAAGQPYRGEYTVTPTQYAQVLETAHLKLSENITVNPIPSNYGLITWNGSTLTVS